MLHINQETDMTITVDEALQAAREHGGCDTDCVTPELAAEVERLRAEQKLDGAEIERLQKVVADHALTIGTLKDELGATTEALAHERDCSTGLADELVRSEKEAATARLALDVATKEIEALRAKLKWFEERDERIERNHSWSVDGRALYEKHNPKPGAAT